MCNGDDAMKSADDPLVYAIQRLATEVLSEALEGYRVLTIHYHQSCCKLGSDFAVWECPEPVCQDNTGRLLRIIPRRNDATK